ncbi:MAG: helix-turn-helix domain-containing protein [Brevibacterium sp.]
MDEVDNDEALVPADTMTAAIRGLAQGNPLDRRSLEAALGSHPTLIDSLVDLSGTMTRWKQKDLERSALLESASELIRVRDTDRLLQKLVDRARSLIGCDIAYLSQYYPETDELRVQASRGAISVQLKELRVPPGIGLAGRVVRDRTAHWTSDYDLTQLPHERQVDSAVRAERMESLLGVPMVVDGEVLGALFAADRYSHEFTSEEIALLSALADHASVVLKTARLMGELAEAARTSAASEELAAAKADTLQRLVEVEEQLTRVVLRGGGSTDVGGLIAATLDAEVRIVDHDRLESSDDDGFFTDTEAARTDILAALETSRETGRCAPVPRAQNLFAASVASQRRRHSGLFVKFRTEPADGDLSIVAQAAQSLALIRMNEQARADAENRVRGELAVDLIAGTRPLDELKTRARTSEFSLDGPWRIIAVETGPDDYDRIGALLTRIEPRMLLTQRSPGLTVLIPSSVHRSRPSLVDTLTRSESLADHLILVSETDHDRAQLRTAEGELWACVRILGALGIEHGVHPAEDFAPYTAMFGTAPEQVCRFLDRMLGRLRDWDRSHSSDLTGTVRAYFDNGGSLTRTATALSVHLNTVKQRLERVDRVLGTGWREPEQSFRLQVALRLAGLATLPD